MGDNLNKVFVDLAYSHESGMRILEWTFGHFDKNKTKFVLTLIDNRPVDYYRDVMDHTYLPKCLEKQFKAEILIPDAIGKAKKSLRELLVKHGMNEFVCGDDSADYLQMTLSDHSCKVWYINRKDGKLASMRYYYPEDKNLLTMVNEETSRRAKVEQELLSMTNQAKVNAQEIGRLRLEINQQKQDAIEREEEIIKRGKTEKELLLVEIDQLKQNKALSTTFTPQELNQATQNFNDTLKIGEGEYGCVYKGIFRGTTVSIKKFKSQSKPGLSVLKQEIVILSTVRHPNLVTFIGACSEPAALVFEFLSRGNLRSYLDRAGDTMPLSWQIRTRIISEVCVALIFLHSNKPNPIIHGDLRPDNILLDSNFTCKLSDFGLIKQIETDMRNSHPTRTLAYMDPEYLNTEEMTTESDVYSFGVLILHLLTGKSRLNISRTVEETIGNDKFRRIIDESAGNWPLQHAEEVGKIGIRCADAERSKRPNLINDVWPTIEGLLKFPDGIRHERGVSCVDQGR